MTYTEILKCRVCGNSDLVMILDLGQQALTGVFPTRKNQVVTTGPLELLKCVENDKNESCGLVQLRQTYDLNEMYGENYGYRSGLNSSMVDHLRAKVNAILERVAVGPGDLVIDIGSNDGSLLSFYPSDGITLVGIDPTAEKLKDYYPAHVQVIPEFFSAAGVRERFGTGKAKVVTSVAMFYDLDDPVDFMRQLHDVLADDGIWVLEQSYMPTMIDMCSYDTVCHEHLEYYRLKQIKWMADRIGFRIVDVEFNRVNGGSYSLVMAKAGSGYKENASHVQEILDYEEARGLGTLAPYRQFSQNVDHHREELRALVQRINENGERIIGYGASTKGNVILQFCNLTARDIPCIAEVNEDKFGCYTPATDIPIIPETDARASSPDYMLVLPWHFKDFFIKKESEYLDSGGKLIFPLPSIEVVARS